ncbi:hypothetical protein [Paenibacillus lutrae]|uniref:Type II secretion system protein GspF domain-containing protein n=1 Tax=Paenibacillus lutrae TaxID=2078573 RepID=A0A7X3FM27_9BACL|nr:hypothetical protein [Paenibacillus lutrae]MVP02127.1 hypothetical protein [Paenibacillus lutrae]
METISLITALTGLVYLVILIAVSDDPLKAKLRFRQRFDPNKLVNTLHDERLQQLLEDAGWKIPSKIFNMLRYGVPILFLFLTYISNYVRLEEITIGPVIYALVALLLTSPSRYLPSGWLLKKLHERRMIRKDGELISFLRLYENNRMKKSAHVQFWAFCNQVSSHFQYLEKEILILGQRTNEESLENGLTWLVQQFPEDHLFISDVRTIILTTEGLDSESAVHFLKEQGKIITKISSDQYLRRWGFIGDIANVFNALPSALTFLMMIVLIMLYVNIIRTNLTW